MDQRGNLFMTVDSKLKFAGKYSASKPVIFEVEETLLESFLNSSSCVMFDEHGVGYLTNNQSTYRIRHADNSNMQLVVEESSYAVDCRTPGVITMDAVMVDDVPLAHIRSVFKMHPTVRDVLPLLRFHTIWSDLKIGEFLSRCDFFYMEEGHWHMLADSEYFELLQLVLNACAIVGKSIVPNSQIGDAYSSEEVWLHLNEFLREEDSRECVQELSLTRVQFLLSRLSATDSVTYKNKGCTRWPLNILIDPTRIVFFQAQYILFRNHATTGHANMSISRFMSELKTNLAKTPSVDSSWIDSEALMALLPAMLAGVGFQDNTSIVYHPAGNLSFIVEDRIVQLFRVKKVWLKEELERLISPLLPEHTKTEAVLMKHGCRLEADDEGMYGGEFVYSYKFAV